MTIPCPSCGFLTIDEEGYGSYRLCQICDWEDDGVQLANPACGGGANQLSLVESQSQALCAHPLSEDTWQGIKRDAAWRPLNESEIHVALAESEESYWKNKAVYSSLDAYWLRIDPSR